MLKFIYLILLTSFINAHAMKVGVSPEFPPFEYKRDNELVGFDIDLARKIASMLNTKAQFKTMEVPELFSALARGDIDMIISSITGTDEIAKEFSVSEPYYKDKLVVLHRNSENIKPPFKDKVIAYPLGSVIEVWCKKNCSPKKFLAIDNFEETIYALLDEKIDGLLIDESQAKLVERQNKLLTHYEIGNVSEGSAVILRKDSKNVTAINKILSKLDEIGYIDQLKLKWIETSHESSQKSFTESFIYIAKGSVITLIYLLPALIISLILGIIMLVCSRVSLSAALISPFISILRGTPLILQLSIAYFALPLLLGAKVSILYAGIITFSLNSSAHVYEVLKTSLSSIPRDQFYACKVLKISTYKTWQDIILPQVIRTSLPLLIVEAVTLAKETALISILGESDILFRAQALTSEQLNFLIPLFVAGLIYWILVKVIEIIGSIFVKRYQYA